LFGCKKARKKEKKLAKIGIFGDIWEKSGLTFEKKSRE